MSLIKWNPENNFFPSFSNWMDDFFPDNGYKSFNGMSVPAVNILETKKDFKLKIAAPGFKKNDFKLEVQHGLLTISGEMKMEKEEKEERYTRQEFSYSTFRRSFTLPENIKADKIGANYEDGLLTVTLPKVMIEEKPKVQIAVK
ncbi:MAG: Hsp20/alpha crystallin family protein [Saprospiraceae bacterium]|nr:Hsp20/alpha crystallin family protein [Saprospiraceae bacterium]MCB9345761.1 Hsp20/alpha crystallin family protein [Lewinellaceae bacterium]